MLPLKPGQGKGGDYPLQTFPFCSCLYPPVLQPELVPQGLLVKGLFRGRRKPKKGKRNRGEEGKKKNFSSNVFRNRKENVLISSWPEPWTCCSHGLQFRSQIHIQATCTHWIANEFFPTDKAKCIGKKFRKQTLLLGREMSVSKGEGLHSSLCYLILAHSGAARNMELSWNGKTSKCSRIIPSWAFSGGSGCKIDIPFFTETASTWCVHALWRTETHRYKLLYISTASYSLLELRGHKRVLGILQAMY